MNLTSDLHHRYVLDRQQRLLAEAASHRLAGPRPARRRIALLFRRADRRGTATAIRPQVGGQLPEHG